jgi:demethylmenaquinone methyltransferase/2-methoxy-6-polyprenyl-1,4-benzoquinol methylase
MAAHYLKKHPGRKIVVGDYEQILFPRGAFDKIIILNAFPHFRNQQTAIKNSKFYLKKDGWLIIAHTMSRHELNQLHSKHAPVAHDVLVDAPTLTAMLEKAGFTHITVDDGTYYFALAQA